MEIFAGMPELGGHLPRVAREAGIPIMVSANRFAKALPPGKWRQETPDLEGSRVVLDSAGFVAMKLYGGYRWSPESYAELAERLAPEWWASMDYCCEPELAKDAGHVGARQWATLVMLRRCRRAAAGQPPMPVIQGWHRDDYSDHAKDMDRVLSGDWPDLVGVGSVCRRSLWGESGVLSIVDRLDSILPARTGLHLFGIKSEAIRYLASCPRVRSVDSMAWDYGARKRGHSGVQARGRELVRWYSRQLEAVSSPLPFQRWI